MTFPRFSLLNTRKTERGAINPRPSAERAAPFALLTGVLIYFAASVIAQTGRDGYRQAYDVWQQVQANLERDAGTGGAAQLAHAERAAAAALTFQAGRSAYLKAVSQDAEQRRRFLRAPSLTPPPDLTPPSTENLASAELQTVNRAIASFATDKDRAIQQLRQALERERVALTALTEAIQARQKSVTAASLTAVSLERDRTRVAQTFSDQTSQFSESVARLESEGAAWTDYYVKLGRAIQTANAPPPPPPPPIPSVTSTAPRIVSVPGIPLARYTGSWTFPIVNGISHGAPPESVELEVHEKDGHADGTLLGRFKAPSGTDPAIRFTFGGDLGVTPTQKFPLVTSDGTAGTLELIPGPAFNLLEVNFQTDPRPNKIRSGNFILVKK